MTKTCRKGGFLDLKFPEWRAKFGGMDASDTRSQSALEAKSVKLEHTTKSGCWAKRHGSGTTERPRIQITGWSSPARSS